MERKIYQKLISWKNSNPHKPLILNGVRQCGKTYILKEMEMDFLIQHEGELLPIEVKGGTSIRATLQEAR